jgi:hypothetical protein
MRDLLCASVVGEQSASERVQCVPVLLRNGTQCRLVASLDGGEQ